MNNFSQASVGMLVAEQPLRAAVFDRYGIDFCCGGKQTLEAACLATAHDIQLVIADIENADRTASDTDSSENWLNASLSDLVDHIENTHHVYLKAELPRLEALAEKVARVHGQKEPRLLKVAAIFADMSQAIRLHTENEEAVLFPFIRQLESKKQPLSGACKTKTSLVASPIHKLEAEHNDAGLALMQMRELTDQYTTPDFACQSWQALAAGLAHLDQDLRTHIHKENTLLFPKARAKELQMV